MKALLSLLVLVGSLANVAQAKYGMYPTKFSVVPKLSLLNSSDYHLNYYGGPIIGSARVVAVYWGDNVDSEVQQKMGGFYAAAINSTQMDMVKQYSTNNIRSVDGREGTNQTLNRGQFGGDYKIKPNNKNTSIDDKDIQSEIEYQVANNNLPKADSNTLYMIHFPAGMKITIEGMKSCMNFCAYHNGFESKTLGNVFYGVMPDFKKGACSFACGGTNAFNTTTVVSSHELFEAITDPFPTPGDKPAYPQAWNTTNGMEVGDMCSGTSGDLSTGNVTYKVQGELDNSTGKCHTGPYTSP